MGDSSSNSSDWRGQILSALRSRNARESEPFRELLALHAKVREQALSLQQENSRLNFEVQKLASEGGVPASPAGGAHAGSGGSGSQDSDPKMEEMKAKLYLLQEELTELLRRKGENAQQVIDLTTQVKTNEKDLNEKAKTLLEQEDKIEKLQAEVER